VKPERRKTEEGLPEWPFPYSEQTCTATQVNALYTQCAFPYLQSGWKALTWLGSLLSTYYRTGG
jgi:hypothetical protein